MPFFASAAVFAHRAFARGSLYLQNTLAAYGRFLQQDDDMRSLRARMREQATGMLFCCDAAVRMGIHHAAR
jgi:hypothetical protein